MKKHTILAGLVSLILVFNVLKCNGQMPAAISIQPENATIYDEITLTFNAELACSQNGSLNGLTSVAMHSGVTINGSAWQYVVAFNSTGANGQSPILSSNPDGTFSITYTPFEFYGFPAGSGVTQICAVFNNGSDWNQDGRDFYQGGPNCQDFLIPIITGSPYEPGLNSIVPDQAMQGETLNVQIYGINTHFENESSQVWLEKDLINLFMTSFYAVNDTLISASIIIPEDAATGFWALNVETPEDGLLELADAFKVNSSGGTMPAAISIYPPDATAYDELTLTFNPEEACFTTGTLIGATQVFIHSGIGLYSGEIWQYVIDYNATGANGQSAQLEDNGDGTWSITYNPSEFYGFEPGTLVTQICGVFNDGTWDKDGRDFEDGSVNCMDFFIPLNLTTGLNNEFSDKFSIVPNPVSDFIFISSPIEIKSCRIYNLFGDEVSVFSHYIGKSLKLDVKYLRTGIYFIAFEDNTGKILTRRFIKE
jgi:hypothetical protein